MAASLVSSIIFFLLFIIFVDGIVFAAQMEHRKLRGTNEIMTMRRNLEGNGGQGSSKIEAGRSTSQHAGQKTTKDKPSETHPNQATAKGKNKYLSYSATVKNQSQGCKYYDHCKRYH